MKNENIIMLFAPEWEQPSKVSKHHMAEYLSKENNVIYIEGPFNPLTFFKRHARRKIKRNLAIIPTFELIPFLKFNKINNRWLTYRLKKELTSIKNPIIIACLPLCNALLRRMNYKFLIYHCSDRMEEFSGFPPYYTELEKEAISMSDIVFVTSYELYKEKIKINKNTLYLPNAAEFERFNNTSKEMPSDLKKIKRPIIGYVGNIYNWFNFDWLRYVALQRPNWNFAIIGKIMCKKRHFLLKNIHCLGPKIYKEMPYYTNNFDVGIIPFEQSRLIEATSPIKFYEYMASGLPVVSVFIPELERYNEITYLCESKEEFLENIEKAITDRRKEERIQIAKNNDWQYRFKEMERTIENLLNDN